MFGAVMKDVSLKNRVLAVLVAGVLVLAASSPTLAADTPDGASGPTGAIALGSKPSIIKGTDVIALGAKLGIAGGQNVVALGAKLGIAAGGNVVS